MNKVRVTTKRCPYCGYVYQLKEFINMVQVYEVKSKYDDKKMLATSENLYKAKKQFAQSGKLHSRELHESCKIVPKRGKFVEELESEDVTIGDEDFYYSCCPKCGEILNMNECTTVEE